MIYITSWRRSKMPQYFYGWDPMDPSFFSRGIQRFALSHSPRPGWIQVQQIIIDAKNFENHWSLRPACHFRDRALASCFFCRRVSSMLIQPSRKTTAKIRRSTWCLRAFLLWESWSQNPSWMKWIWGISCQIINLNRSHWFPRFQLKGQAAHIVNFQSILPLVMHRIKNLGETNSLDRALVGWKGGSGVRSRYWCLLCTGTIGNVIDSCSCIDVFKNHWCCNHHSVESPPSLALAASTRSRCSQSRRIEHLAQFKSATPQFQPHLRMPKPRMDTSTWQGFSNSLSKDI